MLAKNIPNENLNLSIFTTLDLVFRCIQIHFQRYAKRTDHISMLNEMIPTILYKLSGYRLSTCVPIVAIVLDPLQFFSRSELPYFQFLGVLAQDQARWRDLKLKRPIRRRDHKVGLSQKLMLVI